MDRIEVIRRLFDTLGKGLEIGPSYNPLLRKRDGFNVDIVDYTTASELRKIHTTADIEEVDFVTNGAAIGDAVPNKSAYDFIVASHVIEHTTDLIRFINDCSSLLKETGVLVLVVPDKRHCFDMYQPITSTGDILQAHHEQRVRHTSARIFDAYASVIHRQGHIVWPMGYGGEATFVHTLEKAYTEYQNSIVTNTYIDVHEWYFVPSSFRLILRDLAELKICKLREEKFIDSVGPEFYLTLSRQSAGCPLDRLSLTRSIATETRIIPIP